MSRRGFMKGGSAALAAAVSGSAPAREPPAATVVRIAELKIAPQYLAAYTAAVKKEMEVSVRVEPGVLAIYFVADKDDATSLRFFEIYADETAYRAHLASPHFREYFETTKDMIVARRLIETVPIQLSAKTS